MSFSRLGSQRRTKIAQFAAIVVLSAATSLAHAAYPYTETWSGDSTEGWDALWGDVNVSFNEIAGALAWSGADGFGSDWIVADLGASSGAFVGDLIAANATTYCFDIALDGLSADVEHFALELYDAGAGEIWQTDLVGLPAPGGSLHYAIALDQILGGWQYVQGSAYDFQYLLGTVDEVSLVIVEGDGTDGIGASGTLDNFQVTQAAECPEPEMLVLFGSGLLGLWYVRRRNGEEEPDGEEAQVLPESCTEQRP